MKYIKLSPHQTLYLGDYKDVLGDLDRGEYDAIITDPPYDMRLSIEDFSDCNGNKLFFCKPENQFFRADEYLFWTKTPSTKNYSHNCGRFVEIILVKRGIDAPFNPLHWSQMIGIYDDRLIYPPVHPFEKPIALLERLIRIYTNPGDTVFDPFMGSGSVGIACQKLGRRYIGSDIDPEYFALSKRRLEEASNE